MSSGVAVTLVWRRWRIICRPLRSLSRWQALNLGQVSITYSHTRHTHILSPINQASWWEMLKLSKRRHFQEWSLWVISVMDPWALWHGPVICFGGKTYCEHIMQRISHPWPFSNTSLGFSVMYSFLQARVLDDASIALQVLDLDVSFIILSLSLN